MSDPVIADESESFERLEPEQRRPVILHYGARLTGLGDDEFYVFCQNNPQYRMERTAEGDLIVMPPTGGDAGRRNFNLTGQLAGWAQRDGSGVGFDSSTAFRLPNGSQRSPDAAWMTRGRWEALSSEQRKRFPPVCPDFVVEIRSESDSLSDLLAKMNEYAENGVKLGWLIDPLNRTVHIFEGGRITERSNLTSLSADPLLAGFVLDLAPIWE